MGVGAGEILNARPGIQVKRNPAHSSLSLLIHQTFWVKVPSSLVPRFPPDLPSSLHTPPTPERRCSMLLVIGPSAGRQIVSASSDSL